MKPEVSKEMPCLWCGKTFFWGVGMYEFCDDCIEKLEEVEHLVELRFKEQYNITAEIEAMLRR